ncbi:endolytic transglycosylase MltG [bacterium]|nr:endolytic transglycosylase MltG [bacterium]
MKKILTITLIVTIFMITIFKEPIVKYLGNFIEQEVIKRNKSYQECLVIIPPGKNVKEIAKILEEKKIIFSQRIFIALTKALNVENKLRIGRYKLNNKMRSLQIIERLQRGGEGLYKFTIPEGYTFQQIALFLDEKKLVDKDKFLRNYNNVFLLKERERKNCLNLEGYLFPDTYELLFRFKEVDVIKMMIHRFYEAAGDNYQELAKKAGISLHEAVTLASIIEKEVKAPEEKKIISAVFYNRLKKRMPLSSCATVMYALGKHKEKLLYEDLKINSPYNTYLRLGFPPGPICSPGKETLQAAVSPAPVEYLYFVSLGNGRHKFSKDYLRHVKARNTIKK